jgi:WD repeat-containing protein 22
MDTVASRATRSDLSKQTNVGEPKICKFRQTNVVSARLPESVSTRATVFSGLKSDHPDSGKRVAPEILSRPSVVVQGHRSIVNSALFHPSLPLLFTSGIEKHVLAHRSTRFRASSTVAGAQEDKSSAPEPGERVKGEWKFVPREPRVWDPGSCYDEPDDDDDESGDEFATGESLQTLEHFDWLLQNQARNTIWTRMNTIKSTHNNTSGEDEEDEGNSDRGEEDSDDEDGFDLF